MGDHLKTVAAILCGHTLIYTGITFLSGQLLPTTLAGFYRAVPHWGKLLIFAFLLSIPANLLFAWGYRQSGASLAGVVYSIVVVLGAVVVAMLVDQAKLSWGIFGGTLLMVAGAVWITVALDGAS